MKYKINPQFAQPIEEKDVSVLDVSTFLSWLNIKIEGDDRVSIGPEGIKQLYLNGFLVDDETNNTTKEEIKPIRYSKLYKQEKYFRIASPSEDTTGKVTYLIRGSENDPDYYEYGSYIEDTYFRELTEAEYEQLDWFERNTRNGY